MLRGNLLNSDVLKIIRIFIIGLTFLCLITVRGMELREAHQFIYMLGTIVLFGLLLRNIWLTLFLWWAVFSYSFFKFNFGHIYLSNIFYGSVLYFLTKLSFEKKHIDHFVTGCLWLTALNLIYMFIQGLGYDFLYDNVYNKMMGFMANPGIIGMFLALMIPFVMSRNLWAGLLMYIPLGMTIGRFNWLASAVFLMFFLYHKLSKKIWIIVLCIGILLGGVYVYKKPIHDERFTMWQLALKDCFHHPITGWGMDTFRNYTEQKAFIYAITPQENVKDKTYVSWWDNPHNLFISIIFEFGIIPILLLIGYLHSLTKKFKRSIKEPNTIALAGFILSFMLISMGHFPIFLARLAVLIIPSFALLEIQMEDV